MGHKVTKLLLGAASMSIIFSAAILTSPYIYDYIDDTYHDIQVKEEEEATAKKLLGLSKGATIASKAMMHQKKDLIVNINTGGSSGSGVHLTEHVILTAKHVADDLDTESLVKTTYGGKVRIEHPVGVLHHESMDISLIILEGMTPAEQRIVTLRPGIDEERVYRIGFTYGMKMNSSEGKYEADQLPIEKVNKVGEIENLDTFFVAGGGGDSGSAIWGADGQIVGMVNAGPNITETLRDMIVQAGISDLDPTETSITQDKIRALVRKDYMLGYSQNLPKAVDHLYNKLMATGFTKLEKPKPNILEFLIKGR